MIYIPRLTDRSLSLLCIAHEGTSYYPVKNNSYVTYTLDGERRRPLMCKGCLEFFSNLRKHMCECEYNCTQCHHYDCTSPDLDAEDLITCMDCHRGFKNQACFDRHKLVDLSSRNASTIENIKTCVPCGGRMKHDCSKIYCTTCHVAYTPSKNRHVCFIRKPQKKMCTRYITCYYDIETKEMIPYVLVAQTVCHNCFE